jgi:hypothetical protein
MRYLVLECKHNFKTIEKLDIGGCYLYFHQCSTEGTCHFMVQVLAPSTDLHMVQTWKVLVQLTVRVVLQITM